MLPIAQKCGNLAAALAGVGKCLYNNVKYARKNQLRCGRCPHFHRGRYRPPANKIGTIDEENDKARMRIGCRGLPGGGLLSACLCAGYPAGGIGAVTLYKSGGVSKPECERLLMFSNNCGPGFIITAAQSKMEYVRQVIKSKRNVFLTLSAFLAPKL